MTSSPDGVDERSALERSAEFVSELADVGSSAGLSTVLQETPLAVVLLSLSEGRVLYANDVAQAMTPGLTLPVPVAD